MLSLPAPAVLSPPWIRGSLAARESSPRGLTSAETAARRAGHGPDELPAASPGQVRRRLLARFTDLFAVVLLVSLLPAAHDDDRAVRVL
ncbi:cation-transporting P-type ATPase [Streptomyces sp. NPDC004014]